MKVGLIGLGHVASYQIAAMDRCEGIVLSDVYDADAAKVVPRTDAAKRHASLEGYIEQSSADVHFVSTPTPTHFDLAMRLLDAGLRVCVEKPACLHREQLEILAARGRTGFLNVAFHAAFASDVAFWLERREEYDLGRLVGFDCGFFDPYIAEGKVLTGAKSLVGSWVDSGINALSVLARVVDFSEASLLSVRSTSLSCIECADAGTTAFFLVPVAELNACGTIVTNWTLGINAKATTLVFEHGVVQLDHSRRQVNLQTGEVSRVLFEDDSPVPRLQQHYEALLADLARRVAENRPNLEDSLVPHRLLIEAIGRGGQTV